MIEKHRRKKHPRRHPHFTWADPERFRVERMTAGLTQKQAAAYLGVSVRSVYNWETGVNRVPYPAFKLIRMRAKAIVHVEGWDGWCFARDGSLGMPDGRSFPSGNCKTSNWWSVCRYPRISFNPVEGLSMEKPAGASFCAPLKFVPVASIRQDLSNILEMSHKTLIMQCYTLYDK